MPFDINKIRDDFSILKETVYNKPLVYLDNAATTQKPKQVIDVMQQYYLKYNSNVHRGIHYLSNVCTDAVEHTRIVVRDFINAKTEQEIIFTRGTTESINLIAYSFGEQEIHAGDEIVVTEMEHHANIVPWQMLCQRKGAILKVIPFLDNGELDLATADKLLTPQVKLLSLAYVSNVLGTVNPIKLLIDKAHNIGAKVLIDGAQAVQHLAIDVQVLDCDFFVFSAHKLYGPTGVGVLYGKKELLEVMPPWQGGGEMIKEVSFAGTTYNDLPYKFEAGTPDYIGIIGLGEAINYITKLGIANIAKAEQEVFEYAINEMRKIPEIKLYGDAENKISVIAFSLGLAHHSDLGQLLDKLGVAVRTGHLCADTVMQHYGVTGVVRVSFAMYNTKQEVDIFISALRRISQILLK